MDKRGSERALLSYPGGKTLIQRITSSKNSIIKEIKSLKLRKYREELGLFFIEGLRMAEEAVKENARIVRVLMSDRFAEGEAADSIIRWSEKSGCQAIVIPDSLFEEISDTKTPQGILMVAKSRFYEVDEILGNKNYLLVLDSIQDPGNLGTIIRTADAAGFTGMIISKGCVDAYNPKVLRSTMGSIFRMPLCFADSLENVLKKIKLKGIRVYASHLSAKESCYEINLTNNIAIIIGNEANGISDEVLPYADKLVKIPMYGRTESLNASIAAGVLMFECVRQRMVNGLA